MTIFRDDKETRIRPCVTGRLPKQDIVMPSRLSHITSLV